MFTQFALSGRLRRHSKFVTLSFKAFLPNGAPSTPPKALRCLALEDSCSLTDNSLAPTWQLWSRIDHGHFPSFANVSFSDSLLGLQMEISYGINNLPPF